MTGDSAVMTDTLSVLGFLSSSGKIDSEVKERAEAYLRQADAGWETPASINSQSRLYLDDLSVNYLDHVGLLETLTHSVAAVFVHADLDNQTRALLLYDKHAEELLSAIERIRTIISNHVEAGRVHFSARHAQDRTEDTDDEKDEILESAPTLDLLSDLSGIDVVVADDRCLNKSPTCAAATSSLGILAALKRSGELDEQSYRRARHRLRAAGYYAVSLEVAELLYHLGVAPVVDGKVRETPELKAVRESFSLAQINNTFIAAEEPWLNRCRYVVFRAIRDVWSNTPKLREAEAQAEWLLSILPDPLEWCLNPENATVWAAARQQSAVQVGMALVFVNGSRERSSHYFAWLQHAVIDPLQEKHPELWEMALGFFERYAVQLLEVEDEDGQEP
jgi:hypothetical protein